MAARLGRGLLRALLGAFAVLVAGAAAADSPCGPDGCAVAGGRYRIAVPDAPSGTPRPAVVMLHGFRSSGADMLAYPGLAAGLTARGIALIAPDGEEGAWSFPGSPPRPRDDRAFLAAVVEDAARRFSLDRERLVIAGFSLGASMAWSLACAEGGRYPRVVAVAGAFWNPLPAGCAGPVPRLLHIHGRGDRTVPLEGRVIRERWRQGDVFLSLAVWRRQCNGAEPRAASFAGLACEATECGAGRLEVCLHGGGHDLDGRWIAEGAARLLGEGT